VGREGPLPLKRAGRRASARLEEEKRRVSREGCSHLICKDFHIKGGLTNWQGGSLEGVTSSPEKKGKIFMDYSRVQTSLSLEEEESILRWGRIPYQEKHEEGLLHR